MFSSRECGKAFVTRSLAAGLGLILAGAAWAQSYPQVGRTATPKELAAWDIDVRPDFKGLPKGNGTVARGMDVWESKCASCHGVFGESNEVFSPLVGGTTKDDIAKGRVARLTDAGYPGRTTMMKVPTVSTLWDYINRAMPWTQPKSLSTEEVYAVTAYLLNMADVVPADFTLSHDNIAQVQAKMPNRLGMSTAHGMWPGKGMGLGNQGDVKAAACMKDCGPEPKVASFLPDFARNAHGNLAEQNRSVGAQVGADTTQAPRAVPVGQDTPAPRSTPAAPSSKKEPDAIGKQAIAALGKHGCTACHGVDKAVLGPGFRAIAKKHAGRSDVEGYFTDKIKKGGAGVWGAIPMPPQNLPDSDARLIAKWLAEGAKR
jgi:cytochrome c